MLKKLAVAAALVGGGSAVADPKFEFGKAEEVQKVKGTEWTATAEAGIVFTTGNSETITASGGLKATRKQGNNKLAIEASGTYAQAGIRVLADLNGNETIDSDDEIRTVAQVTAETIAGRIRYDRFLTEFNSLFAALLASRDLPAGKERVLGGQVGYSRRITKTKTSEMVGELGFDAASEDLIVGDPVSILSARAFVGYKAEMTTGTTFETTGELLTNLNTETLPYPGARGEAAPVDDTRVNFKASISSKIGKNLAFATTFESKYDHRPAPLAVKGLAPTFVPEAAKLDTIMKASLIYTFF
ncbi:MAG: DUF481 domain-containing protein [Kofleriaceae bacterium]|nr:DUF481 domain-containing protein [Kofleriaceae bacterium]